MDDNAPQARNVDFLDHKTTKLTQDSECVCVKAGTNKFERGKFPLPSLAILAQFEKGKEKFEPGEFPLPSFKLPWTGQ